MKSNTLLSFSIGIAALMMVFATPAEAHRPLRSPVSNHNKTVGAALDPSLFSGLVWRNVGPFRGGRISAVSGAIGQPGVFYCGAPMGGVWKSTNAGITWTQVFDSVKDASSVGSVEVAPSDPNIVYVGLGDGTTGGGHDEGNGIYKSTDAGKTWQHMGLDDAMQIPSILVDPKNPNIVMAAVLGEARKPGPDRGVYRSTDGGKTWTKTLYTDDQTGVQKLAWAYDNPDVILATTNRHASPSGAVPRRGTPQGTTGVKGTAIFKSTDRGLTWKEIKGNGLPSNLFGRTCVAVAMNTNSQRMYFVSNSGLWRSDDGGDHWKQMDVEDSRIRNGQGGYNCGVYVNSKDPDTVYVLNTCSYVSHDGGKTFTGFKGAPGGDDPQQMWGDPTDGNRLFFGVDQGPTVSLDGGQTWSGWYNIPNGQFYHLAVSNSWPYWIYATMQDSGAIGMSSRGNFGEITPLDWSPNPGWEWGSITVDPLNPNILYSTGQQNDIIKQYFPTGQYTTVGPDANPKLALRHDFNQPIMFSPVNPHELFLGYQFLMSSTDGGKTWKQLGPDLSFPKDYVPPKPEVPKKETAKPPVKPTTKNEEADEDDDDDDNQMSHKDAMEHAQEEMDLAAQRGGGGGVISSLSPSSLDNGIIWAGISNGTIKLTKDHGKTWDDVNLPTVQGSITSIDASHTDPASAYIAISRQAANEPLVYRTKNFGKTWTKIINGLPTGQTTGSWTNTIRSDTKRDGLLFLGTESSVYVSFNDGDAWQPLSMGGLPTTSYRDMVIKDNDLVVATYGRSFWILDDISPLRQVKPDLGSAYLFAPGDAVRVRRNVNADTPLPPEVPHALNAPPGALIYYYLGTKPGSDITLDITDSKGKPVRHYSSAPIPPLNEGRQPIPDFWIEILKPMPTDIGTNRINWDLRYEAPFTTSHTYEISANPGLTPASPQGPLVAPGTYTVTLTVDGKKYVQTVKVTNDPRSPGSSSDLRGLHDAQMALYDGNRDANAGTKTIAKLREQLTALEETKPPKEILDAANALEEKLRNLGAPPAPRRGGGGFATGGSSASFASAQAQTVHLLGLLENADIRPNEPVSEAIKATIDSLNLLKKNLKTIEDKDLKDLNEKLKKAGLPLIG